MIQYIMHIRGLHQNCCKLTLVTLKIGSWADRQVQLSQLSQVCWQCLTSYSPFTFLCGHYSTVGCLVTLILLINTIPPTPINTTNHPHLPDTPCTSHIIPLPLLSVNSSLISLLRGNDATPFLNCVMNKGRAPATLLQYVPAYVCWLSPCSTTCGSFRSASDVKWHLTHRVGRC